MNYFVELHLARIDEYRHFAADMDGLGMALANPATAELLVQIT